MGKINLKGMTDFDASNFMLAWGSWWSVLLFGTPTFATVTDLGNGVTEIANPGGGRVFQFRAEITDYQTSVIETQLTGDENIVVTGGVLNSLDMWVPSFNRDDPARLTLSATDIGIDIGQENLGETMRLLFIDLERSEEARNAESRLNDLTLDRDWVVKGRNSDDLISNPDDETGTIRFTSGGGEDGLVEIFTGDDTFFGRGGNDTLWLRAGNDIGRGGNGNDVIYGGDGDDQLFGQKGRDRLFGDDGDDMLSGGAARDLLNGGKKKDILDGGAGNDRLIGGGGDDRLTGGTGSDVMKGGAGNDRFEFVATGLEGDDLIRGFQQGRDMLEVASTYLESFSDALNKASDEANGVRIQFNENSSVLIEGLSRDDLQQSDFFILSL